MTSTSSTFSLCGVKVEFPYPKPYGAQKALMCQLISALKGNKNALLEVILQFYDLFYSKLFRIDI